MATWPSGSKASTTNLDAGSDRPSLARADIKQNVDNVNSIIDMFSISAPVDGYVLKYNNATSNFTLGPDSAGVQHINAGTGIIIDEESDGGVTISASVTDTTYTFDAETDGSNANLKLVGSDSTEDIIQLVAGSNITITVDSGGAITLDAVGGISDVVSDTTPQLGGALDGQGEKIEDVELDNYKETIYTGGSTTGTITPDVANGNVQKITLTGSITFNGFANAETGQSMTLIIDNGTGGYTLTSTMYFAGGNKDLTGTASAFDIISVFYDGTNYYASLSTSFS